MWHLVLHVLVPLLVTAIFFRRHGFVAFYRLMAGMVIDVDHLSSSPIYNSERCSINNHFLHTTIPIMIYCLLFSVPRLRIFSIGLMIHIVLDYLNCYGFPDHLLKSVFNP